jgi:hypothetical protein
MGKKVSTIEPWQQQDAARLEALFNARAQVSQSEFGERYEIGSQGMVWQYLSGHRALNIKAAAAFARGLGVHIDEFSPTLAEQIALASVATEASCADDWPFSQVDEAKTRALSDTDRARLEAAVLIAAAQVGLDVKKG